MISMECVCAAWAWIVVSDCVSEQVLYEWKGLHSLWKIENYNGHRSIKEMNNNESSMYVIEKVICVWNLFCREKIER